MLSNVDSLKEAPLYLRNFSADDSFSEKKARVGKEDAVPAAALMEILEESIRLFWEFVHSDKEEGDAIHRACKKNQFDLLNATDLELLIATRNLLQKVKSKSTFFIHF